MDFKKPVMDETGLRFFSHMSAANAHEIKNALAVINENAGLLEDLVDLSEKGLPLDSQRLKRLAGKIKQQVARADKIAKSTNRFAHSVDLKQGPANLERSLRLIKTMAMRFATQRHIDIEIIPIAPTITLSVQPFRLLHLLWMCLQCAMDATDSEETIQIASWRDNGCVRVQYGPLAHLEQEKVSMLDASYEMQVLLQPLNGQLTADARKKNLLLTFRQSPED
jgi:C4-dicarboxylate-specific signal transduction histidine kinase